MQTHNGPTLGDILNRIFIFGASLVAVIIGLALVAYAAMWTLRGLGWLFSHF